MEKQAYRRIAAVFLPIMFTCCTPQPIEAPPAEPKARDPWIGIAMSERQAGTYAIGKEVVIDAVIPDSPADGVLEPGDVIMSLQGEPINDALRVQELVAAGPTGDALAFNVRRSDGTLERSVRSVPRPTSAELLEQTYLDKPFPAFSEVISIARTDGSGGIVPGSGCVMEDDAECPGYGKPGDTRFAKGNATIVAFWGRDAYGERANSDMLKTVGEWQKELGPQNLAVVSVTSIHPSDLPRLVRKGRMPEMTLVSLFYGDYGRANMAKYASPCALLLDKDGVVRATALATDGGKMKTLRDIASVLNAQE